MQMVSYLKVVEDWEAADRGFCGVRENDDDEHLYGTPEQLYEELLDYLRKEFLEDKYSLCLQVRDKDSDDVIYEFPRVPCPELFLEQLKLKKIRKV